MGLDETMACRTTMEEKKAGPGRVPEGLNKGSAVPHGEGKLCHPVAWTLMSLPWLETAAGMGWDGMGFSFSSRLCCHPPRGARDKPGLCANTASFMALPGCGAGGNWERIKS